MKLLLSLALSLCALTAQTRGSISGAGQAATISVEASNYSTVGVQVEGTWSATIQFEGSMDCSTWIAVTAYAMPDPSTGAGITSTTANGNWVARTAGLCKFRVRASAYASGSAYVTFSLSSADTSTLRAVQTDSSGNVTIGTKVLLSATTGIDTTSYFGNILLSGLTGVSTWTAGVPGVVSGTATDCVKVNGTSGACGSGGGMADPGANGIVKRTALNTTAAATPGTDYYAPGGAIASTDLPNPGASAGGKVRSATCSAGQHVSAINTDSTVTCSADAAGTVGMTINNSGTSATAVAGWNLNDTTGAFNYTLPTASAGAQYCFRNATGRTGAITLTMPASTTLDIGGVAGSAAGTYVAGGALGDSACVTGLSSTKYIGQTLSGTWTLN